MKNEVPFSVSNVKVEPGINNGMYCSYIVELTLTRYARNRYELDEIQKLINSSKTCTVKFTRDLSILNSFSTEELEVYLRGRYDSNRKG